MRNILGASMALILSVVAAAANPIVSPGDVLAVVTEDWDEDGGQDRAVLVANGEGADLYLYLSGDGPDERILQAHIPRIVWRGAAWGQQPGLDVNEAGSLRVRAGNDAIGRSRWEEVLTIAYRKGAWVVAGYTYTARDTLDLDFEYACDINLFNGRGVFNGRPWRSRARVSDIDDWRGETRPGVTDICPEMP